MFYRNLAADELKEFEHAVQSLINIYGPANIFAADNLITFDRHLSFGLDPQFREAFIAESMTTIEHSLVWRLHVLCWAGRHAMNLPGDFVECGVYEGFSSAVLARYLDFGKSDKRLWLYDLFDHTAETSGTQMPAHGVGLTARVTERFSNFPNVRIMPGMIPASFDAGIPDRIAWFHLDLNDAVSETRALERLFERLSPGGVLVLDDYGWKSYAGQKEAADKFASAHNHMILELPTGQGLLIKH